MLLSFYTAWAKSRRSEMQQVCNDRDSLARNRIKTQVEKLFYF